MIEQTILSSLVLNEDFARKTIPYLREEYFSDASDKLVYSLIDSFFRKYNRLPNREILKIELETMSVSQTIFDSALEKIGSLSTVVTNDLDWLLDQAEKFCQDKAIYNSIHESIQILDGKSKLDKGAIPTLLQEALAVSFDESVGHDYLEDAEARFDSYNETDERIKFSLDLMNKITHGGLSRKTLNIYMAGTGAGKSMLMCHEAANNLMDGRNVLYITLEMSQKKISERIDANLLDVNVNSVKDMPKEVFKKKIAKLKEKTLGRLIVKEYPTSQAHAGHIRFLLNELKTKKNFVPDIIYVDYINLCASSRLKAGNVNSYTYIKAIAEELRGLAVEFNVALVSATQVTRSGYGASDIDLTDTSESFGLPATADLMIALIVTEELEELNQVMFKQLKNRYGDPNFYKKFLVGRDSGKMRFYDIANDNDEPVFDKTTTGERTSSGGKFSNLSFG
jgi:replicative DNA helicase